MLNLPQNCEELIFKELSNNDLLSLSYTCRYFYDLILPRFFYNRIVYLPYEYAFNDKDFNKRNLIGNLKVINSKKQLLLFQQSKHPCKANAEFINFDNGKNSKDNSIVTDTDIQINSEGNNNNDTDFFISKSNLIGDPHMSQCLKTLHIVPSDTSLNSLESLVNSNRFLLPNLQELFISYDYSKALSDAKIGNLNNNSFKIFQYLNSKEIKLTNLKTLSLPFTNQTTKFEILSLLQAIDISQLNNFEILLIDDSISNSRPLRMFQSLFPLFNKISSSCFTMEKLSISYLLPSADENKNNIRFMLLTTLIGSFNNLKSLSLYLNIPNVSAVNLLMLFMGIVKTHSQSINEFNFNIVDPLENLISNNVNKIDNDELQEYLPFLKVDCSCDNCNKIFHGTKNQNSDNDNMESCLLSTLMVIGSELENSQSLIDNLIINQSSNFSFLKVEPIYLNLVPKEFINDNGLLLDHFFSLRLNSPSLLTKFPNLKKFSVCGIKYQLNKNFELVSYKKFMKLDDHILNEINEISRIFNGAYLTQHPLIRSGNNRLANTHIRGSSNILNSNGNDHTAPSRTEQAENKDGDSDDVFIGNEEDNRRFDNANCRNLQELSAGN
ncbi:hypothetical protein PACTADRAFT_286 [Pachysolen tannophilus NRRL Y-2460]|uniref:F-box domain-containing protein n=1 Tax=Pachysolen tannophilus NRRL Y-2460 TaxID=669874 RepID=A0A1E4U1A1_PACTA|nr:hypothetical protein PACTADRAFT_286 [Pachysolen tannophilus NRRL Y-2460]